MKPVMKEIIVVEGKDDTRRLQEVVVADTIETIGSAINQEILEQIRRAQQVRGVIVFTDPDFSGEKIRKTIAAYVPEAKHAFITRQAAAPKRHAGSLGVEHADDQAILQALQAVMTPSQANDQSIFDRALLLKYGLLSDQRAKARRQRLGEELGIGYTNGKQLLKRLNMFRITEEEFMAAMQVVLEEEKNGK